MKNYRLSKKALKEYRIGAKKDADLSTDILKTKLNCLIDAARTTNKKFLKTDHFFGKCIITTNIFNTIINIRWENSLLAAKEAEIKTLLYNYKHCGLNSRGNKF